MVAKTANYYTNLHILHAAFPEVAADTLSNPLDHANSNVQVAFRSLEVRLS
jgi:hypothetical protein